MHYSPMTEHIYPKMNLYKRIVEAKLFIDRHYEESIQVNNIAGEACFSKFHFIRLFKKIYGSTPHRYLTRVRISKAKELLAAGMNVEEVCFNVGFDSVTSFTGLFRRMVKLSPSAYRARRLHLKQDSARQPYKYIPGCHISAFNRGL